MGILAGIGEDSLVTTLSAWVLSLAEMGSDRGTKASAGASYAVAAEAMASATTSTLSKKPFIGALALAGDFLLMG